MMASRRRAGKISRRSSTRRKRERMRKKPLRCALAVLVRRLSRNMAFIANLLEAGTDFVAGDNPHANKPMVQMMAKAIVRTRDC